MISAAGKASHIPFIPQMRDMVKAQKIIAANPLIVEVIKAERAFSVALRYPVPTIFS